MNDNPNEARRRIRAERAITATIGLVAVFLISWGLLMIYQPLCPLVLGCMILVCLALPDQKGRRR